MGCAEKVVLADLGGVDTSRCIAYLKVDEETNGITKAIASSPNQPSYVEFVFEGTHTSINKQHTFNLWL